MVVPVRAAAAAAAAARDVASLGDKVFATTAPKLTIGSSLSGWGGSGGSSDCSVLLAPPPMEAAAACRNAACVSTIGPLLSTKSLGRAMERGEGPKAIPVSCMPAVAS